MKIDFTKSWMNKWSISGLFVILILILIHFSAKAYRSINNESLLLGEYIAYAGGDTDGYIEPIEHYIETGEYKVDSSDEKSIGRGPYYGIYYWVFRQFLSIPQSFDAVAFVQIVWFAIAVILLMLMIAPYIKYKSLVWIIPFTIIVLQLGFGFVSRIITDSLATSQLICFAYFYVRFNKDNKLYDLGLSALFLAMASVMKPYLLPIYAICFFDWAISNKVFNVKRWAKYVAIMSVPLIIICLPFTIRNAVKLHIFAPMQNTVWAGVQPDPVNSEMRKMVRTWGEDHTEWGGVGTYFMPCEGVEYTGDIPSHIYTTDYNEKDIESLAIQLRAYDQMEEGTEKDSIGAELISIMKHYRESYMSDHPLWRVHASLRQLGFLVLPSTSFYINHRHNGIRHYISNSLTLIKLLYHWILFIIGILGLLYVLIKNKNLRIISLVTLYIVLLFTILMAGESRFYLIGQFYETVGLVAIINALLTKCFR